MENMLRMKKSKTLLPPKAKKLGLLGTCNNSPLIQHNFYSQLCSSSILAYPTNKGMDVNYGYVGMCPHFSSSLGFSKNVSI